MNSKDSDGDDASMRLLAIANVDDDEFIIRVTNGYNYYFENSF